MSLTSHQQNPDVVFGVTSRLSWAWEGLLLIVSGEYGSLGQQLKMTRMALGYGSIQCH